MTQTQFLLFIIAAIPFLNCLLMRLCKDSPTSLNLVNKFLPLLFLANLIGLCGNVKNDSSYLTIAEAMRGISLGFAIDEIALKFSFLLNFFWLIFIFYSQRFLQMIEEKNSYQLKFFFLLIVAFVNLIILSKNPLSILFFYNCLLLLCHFFAVKFLHKADTKFSRLFTFLLYLESVFLFLAIVATYKFTGQIDFANGGVISQNFDQTKHVLLLFFYLSGLFLSVLLPCYLLYRNITLDPLVIYTLFFLAYGFSSLYIFVKLLNFIFGLKGFALIISKIGFGFFEWIFLLNIGVSSWLLLVSKGLKSSLFYLFFQQFLFALFSIILFATFNGTRIYLGLFSFLLSMTLIFLCLSNFILYLTKAENKRLDGLFYKLTVTSVLFIFGVLNLSGAAPALGAVEKFFLIKIIFQKKLWVSGLILFTNFVGLIFFSWKIFRPLFLRSDKEILQVDSPDTALAKNIDFDSSLILTALTVAVAMLLGLTFFPLITNS